MPPLDVLRDPHERPITEAVEQLLLAASAKLGEWQKEARRNLAELSDRDLQGDIHTAVRSAEGRFETIVKTCRPALDDKRLETEKRRADLAKFRKDNDLTRREPSYPSKSRRGLMVGILMILLVIESFANAAFLAKGNELGLFGGWVVALGVSALNILSSFLIFGPVSRNLSHVSRWRRGIATATMALYAGCIFILNLGVAHYREVSSNLIAEAGVAVVQRIMDNPFGLNDAESWLLFGLGILFSVIAFLEGRGFDDIYPDYGRRDRATHAAREEYLHEFEAIYEELDTIRNESLEDVKRIAHEARQQPEERRRIAHDWRQRVTEFDQQATQLQQIGEALTDEYREANRTARPDGAVPVSHRTPWQLSIPPIDRDEPMNPRSDQSIEETMHQIDEEYRHATEQICERCKVLKDSLTPAGRPSPADTSTRPTVVSLKPGRGTQSVGS